jgi:hypothetical protein
MSDRGSRLRRRGGAKRDDSVGEKGRRAVPLSGHLEFSVEGEQRPHRVAWLVLHAAFAGDAESGDVLGGRRDAAFGALAEVLVV